MKKKTLAMLMAAALCVGLLPANAMASLQEQTITTFSDAEEAQETSDGATLDFADEIPTETGEDPQGEATDAEVQDSGEAPAGTNETENPQEELVFGNEATDENVIVTDEQEVPQTDHEQEETEENDIALLDATQVLEGSGSVLVYDRDSKSETPEYILKVTDAPTNTEINLESPHITLTYMDGSEVEGVVLSGNLTYVSDAEEEISVAYLKLDDDTDEDGYVLTPYGADDEALDMDSGRLVITVPDDLDIVYIYKIQTNALCYEDESGEYQTEVIEATYASEPILCDLEDYAEGDTVDLAMLAGVSDGDFFYGSIDGTFSLSPCSQAQVQDGKLLPLDESGSAVSEVDIYFAYDELYSFDVVVGSVVNEHTEDNGDAYLWFGDTFYVDQYHSQGVYLTGYSNNATETADCGIWPMLGRTREALINGGTYGFDHWMGQDLNTWEKVKAYDGVSGNDLTKSASGKDNGDKNYGIVGPFQFTDGETAVTQSTVRVTGRIGDEYTSSEVFGSGDIYMIREDSDYHTEWYNLGSHASDNGKRAWFYWINNFYILNNYQDLLEYVQITEDETSGEIHLLADEIGEDGSGELIDVWDLEGIYTKRDSAVKTYIADHADELIEMGVGLSEYLGWLDHIQLRMYTTVETVINGIEYNGTLSLMTRSYTPTVTYDITYTDIDGTTQHKTGSETVTKQNEQECNPVEFDFYINPEEAFDADNVQITMDLGFNGTLYGEDGSTIEYTNDDPYIYQATLTSEQLWEAYDCCPNNTGYDFAINLSDAVKTYAEDSITLYKIWDDESNAGHIRDNVTSVSVYLERSEDGETWEDVVDEAGAKRAFVIHGSADSDVWSLTLTAGDLDLTYTDTNGAEQEYQFRISSEQDLRGVSGNAHYTYTIGEGELSLTVTNTLETYPIDIVGEKQWLDENGESLYESMIPDHAIIALYRDGKYYDMTTVTKEDNWSFSFNNLPQLPEEAAYIYTLGELSEDGTRIQDGGYVSLDGSSYQVDVEETEDGYIIKNILDETEVQGSKTWDDEDDVRGKRPESITVRLYADGIEKDHITVTEADGWEWTFDHLAGHNADGSEIVYTVTEDALPNYSASYDGYDVTNTYTPDQTSLTVVKSWDDGSNADGIRPDSIVVELLQNGTATGDTLILNSENSWIGTFTELDLEDVSGNEYMYTVQEVAVNGYTTEITGSSSTAYVIVNTHIPDTDNPDDGNPNTQTGPGPVVGNPNNNNPDNSNPSSTSGGKTGENNMFYLWIILIAAAAAMVVIVVSMRTRKEKVRK